MQVMILRRVKPSLGCLSATEHYNLQLHAYIPVPVPEKPRIKLKQSAHLLKKTKF